MRRMGSSAFAVVLSLTGVSGLSVCAEKTAPAPAGLSSDQKILHALNRLTFGPRPNDFDQVKRDGSEDSGSTFSLHPDRIAAKSRARSQTCAPRYPAHDSRRAGASLPAAATDQGHGRGKSSLPGRSRRAHDDRQRRAPLQEPAGKERRRKAHARKRGLDRGTAAHPPPRRAGRKAESLRRAARRAER